jgi:kynurenine 3-monooxygenase
LRRHYDTVRFGQTPQAAALLLHLEVSMNSSSITNAQPKIVLVGAGLVGSLLAIFLARRGLRTHLCERRADIRKESIAAGRSINLAVSTRGLNALNEIGLKEEILKEAIPMKGRMIHSLKGELMLQPYGKDDSECINSISRAGLNKKLMNMAEQTGLVEFHFNKRASAIDFDSGIVQFFDEDNHEESLLFADIVIGTDGSASAIRAEMMKQPGYQSSESYLDYGYKELVILPGPGGEFQLEKNALHIWPRGTYMLIALPNFDGSFTCTLFLPYKGEVSFEQLKDKETVLEFFTKQFPDAIPLIPNLVETFHTNPTGHMVTVKCHPWSVNGRALLIGDAAHAIVPFFGQGMNCGFEDLTVLDQCFNRHTPTHEIDWQRVFEEFFALRKDNCDAIADMAVENFIEMRDKVANPQFQLEKAVEKILQKEFPNDFSSRYSLVTFSNVPYNFALKTGVIIDEILKELCVNLLSADQVDLKKAQQLIQTKLSPLLHGYARDLFRSSVG